MTVTVDVPARDRGVLTSWVRSPSMRAGVAQRARIVLLAADGVGTGEIRTLRGRSISHISHIVARAAATCGDRACP
ncbi:MAG: hypothetical protein ACRDST_07820 [Pseudonocardiaceae bacterium]